ncbi:MAG: hypothetical protein J6A74_04485 [Oscillospiraceae bacterium]|nr:hypothetical protein [Oscillospiraceae bacterium]
MTRKKILLISTGCFLVLALCILIGVLCTPNERPLKDPIACYQQISENTTTASDHAYEVTVETTVQVNGQKFAEHTHLTLLRRYLDGQPVLFAANRTATVGPVQYTCSEWLENDMLYLDLNGLRFVGSFKQKNPYPPLVFLSGDKYTQVEGTDWGDKITLDFREATTPEEWALPQGAIFQQAYGALTASKDMLLEQCSYSITYTHGSRQVTQTYTASPLSLDAVDFQKPDKSAYTEIPMIEAPFLLEQMSGYLLQAKKISSNYNEYIYCQTFGDQRTRDMALTVRQEDPFYASLTTAATLVNSSRVEDISSVRQEEIFQEGIYSRASGSEPAVQDDSITREAFQTHCQDLLVGTVLLPQFIRDVAVQEDEATATLLITPTEDLANLLCEEAGQSLYQDHTVLSGTASSSATELLSAYLTIDKATHLPTASGIHYKGIYTITELPYRLEYTTDQTYQFQ